MDINHHLLAGFKALFSEEYLNFSETVRKTCGGAGFASNSGFSNLYSLHVPLITYEGDNTVMLLQATRYLIKLIKKANQGQALPFPFEYLTEMSNTLLIQDKGRTMEECLDLEVLDRGLQALASQLIKVLVKEYNSSH